MTLIQRSFTFSVLFHGFIFASAYAVLPNLRPDISDAEEIVVVEMVDIAELTNAPRALPEPEEKPEPEKMPEPEPEPEPAPPPPAPKPVVKAPEPEPAPPPVESEPEVAALPPEPKPEPEPEKKPEPEPEVVEKPAPPEPSKMLADAKPKKKPKPPDPFASVLKTLEDLKKQVPVEEEESADKDEKEDDKKTSFEEQIAQALQVTSTKAADTSRPISISVREAVAAQLRRCWIVPAGAKNAEELIISIRVDMNPDATVRNSSIADMERAMTDSFYRAAAESALRATKNPRCQPLPLPLDQYDQWRTMTLNFNPQDML